jgi:hypothetical protein
MTHPAEPERHMLLVGTANPHQSLWVIDHPYLGPPEEGQPRVGLWKTAATKAQPQKRQPAKPDAAKPAVADAV